MTETETPPDTSRRLDPGDGILIGLAVFIVLWGPVYGLWRYWPIPAVVLAWAVAPRRN